MAAPKIALAAAASFAAAVNAPMATVAPPSTPMNAVMPWTTSGFFSMNSASGSISFVSPSAASPSIGVRASPTAIFTLLAAFWSMVKRLSVVAYRFSASLVRATFSLKALLAVRMALLIRSPDPARDRTIRCILASLMPRSFRMTEADAPFLSTSFRPVMKDARAFAASFPHACENWSALIPATLANSASPSPVSTAIFSSLMSLDMLVEPAAVSIPREVTAAARPIISASLIPASDPDAAMP